MSISLLDAASPYVAYAYSYPHKSAYRQLAPAVTLEEAWRLERCQTLFLYLHVPFCEYRCGFCNLFTLANADSAWTRQYLRQLKAEADAVRDALPGANFARVAIGGGTPTFLDDAELVELLEIAGGLLVSDAFGVPASCEASPATLTESKAQLLSSWGVERISLGVQTFRDDEARLLGRPQRAREVVQAIDLVRRFDFPVLNLDLIYGAQSQSLDSWMETVRLAIDYLPEEIYLYPLYVRELTGLARRSSAPSDDRLWHYRQARDTLLHAGYRQASFRMFHLPREGAPAAPVYCCQTDGMIGLGCGARSYTRDLHYSAEYAVGRTGVRSILADYLRREPDQLRVARHGFRLDQEDQRRRFAIQGILQADGVSLASYRRRFASELVEDLPQLGELLARGWAVNGGDAIQLTPSGIERSDVIGPWLFSARVRQLMEEYECR